MSLLVRKLDQFEGELRSVASLRIVSWGRPSGRTKLRRQEIKQGTVYGHQERRYIHVGALSPIGQRNYTTLMK